MQYRKKPVINLWLKLFCMPLVVGIFNNLWHILLIVTSTQHTALITHYSALSTQNSELRTQCSTITTQASSIKQSVWKIGWLDAQKGFKGSKYIFLIIHFKVKRTIREKKKTYFFVHHHEKPCWAWTRMILQVTDCKLMLYTISCYFDIFLQSDGRHPKPGASASGQSERQPGWLQ